MWSIGQITNFYWRDRRLYLLQNSYIRQKVVVRTVDEEWGPEIIQRGVRQVCPISTQFSIYAEFDDRPWKMLKKEISHEKNKRKLGKILDLQMVKEWSQIQKTVRFAKVEWHCQKQYNMKISIQKHRQW